MLLLIASQKQVNFFQAFSLEIKWRQYKTDLNWKIISQIYQLHNFR